MGGLLVAGTTSDAGKSVVTTGLCRALVRRGVRVAPYKAQNMSNNSMVVEHGGQTGEIGRAQWVQALAARVEPEVAMNPVLLKPGSDRRSHVVLLGRPAGHVEAGDFATGRRHLAAAAHAAFDDLAARHDVVVAEGAGSPAEINLRASDYVNMGLARHADLPTVVVGDIDRGGVFAAFVGTLALLDADDARLVAGWVVNKFRGDRGLLQPGLDLLTERTGRPTYGVLPWHPDLWLDSEDALDLDGRRAPDRATRRVAVVRFPRISNFTDVDALGLEPDLDVVFAASPRGLADADLVVLPGTRATLADLAWLRERGLDRAVLAHAAAGRPVLGVCGGAQMLGATISDPDGVEGPAGAVVAGLGLLDLVTTFGPEKVLRRHEPAGYEIHHGRVSGELARGAVTATMVHGSLEDDAHRAAYLAAALGVTSRVSFPAARERRLDLLGDLVEEHLDVDALLALATDGVPRRPVRESPVDRGFPTLSGVATPDNVRERPSTPRRVLILGGTAEARELAALLVADGDHVTTSLAGRVARPRLPVGEVRVGGFGGVEGLREAAAEADVVVDATHPFAATISANAVAALAELAAGPGQRPLLRLQRPGWTPAPGADWTWAADHETAAALTASYERPFVTTGRQRLGVFAEVLAELPVLARVVDPVAVPEAWTLLLSRGPYTTAGETSLLRGHGADVLVTKDSGGDLTRAKLDAAAALGVPVIVVERPPVPDGVSVVADVRAARAWVREQ